MTASTTLDQAMLERILGHQHHVISRGQAIGCGMSPQALRHRIRPGGPWQRLLRGVYLARTGSPTVDQRDVAALLYAGQGSVITGCAALARLGIRAPRAGCVDVLVPTGRRRQSTGFVRVRHTKRMPDLVYLSGPIHFADVARAVADAVRVMTGIREIRAVVAGSVQQGRCVIPDLARELGAGPKLRSAGFRQVLAEVADGIRSVAEAEFRDLIRRAGLPAPVFNARLYAGDVLLGVADAWWPDAGVVAEVDSREWHLSAEGWQQTMRRHARLTAEGLLVLHFAPQQIRAEPARVIATLRAALDVRQGATQLRVRALPAAR
jgi:very-short-patch-repair endonuclease